MSYARKVFAVAVLAVVASAVAPVTEAQPPIRIGATLSQAGVYAALGQNQLRGYQLCVKHVNDKGGVLGRKPEKHKMPMVAPSAGATSLYRKGRKFIFMVPPPAEVRLEGLIDLAAKKGLKTVALINGMSSFSGRRHRPPSSSPRRRGFRWSSSTPTRRGTPTSPRS